MLLKPHGRIDLECRAYKVRGSPTGSLAVADRNDRRLMIIRPDFETTESVRLRAPVGTMSLHPSKPLLAWVDGKSGVLKVQSLEGVVVAKITPPSLAKGTSEWLSQGFHDCYFDASGNHLYPSLALIAEANDHGCGLLLKLPSSSKQAWTCAQAARSAFYCRTPAAAHAAQHRDSRRPA